MNNQRLLAIQAVGALLLVVLAVQLVRLQLYAEVPAPSAAQDAARGNISGEYVRSVPVEPLRGQIMDRTGSILASNVATFSLALVPGNLPADPAQRLSALRAIERVGLVPRSVIEEALAQPLAEIDPLAPLTLREGFGREEAIALRAALADVPAARVRTAPRRVYGGGDVLAHMVGYVGPITAEQADAYLDAGYRLDALVGRAGVEMTYETELRGEDGERLVLSDPVGRELRSLGAEAPSGGVDLILSIEMEMQRAAIEALVKGIEQGIAYAVEVEKRDPEELSRSGAAVLIDVRSGELLALATYPSYDVSAFGWHNRDGDIGALLNDPTRPLVHRAYMDAPAPGSIFKPFVGAAALQEGVATPGTEIFSSGTLTVRSIYDPEVVYTYRDWAPHGLLNFYTGLTRSSDVYYYYLAGGYDQDDETFEGLGIERLSAYARAFGFGAPTGLDLPGESAGLVPDADWKAEVIGEPWVLGDSYNMGIGQGYVEVTPLQMAVATAALANGGDLLVPRIGHALRTPDGVIPLERRVAGTVPIDAEHLEVVREALRRAADDGGTAWRGEPVGIEIAGKTGTAEFGTRNEDGLLASHGWYIGFAPYDDPEVAIVVYLEYGVGATHAGPVAREILAAYFGLHMSPEEEWYWSPAATVGRSRP
ncbi:MAG: penicillin-binding protein 2 [Chloroflexi bacterium]|nr:penicillin-binding protein 2 [Chloroflexota bacterium]